VTDYRLTQPAEAELDPIKKSRFIGRLVPVDTREAAATVVAQLRKAWPEARHHAWAFRLQPNGADVRCSDDGEPTGTAGRPALRCLEQSGLIDCVVVVTRFSGGIKLGAGGLTRAYGAAARAAVDAAREAGLIQEIIPSTVLEIRCSYAHAPILQRLLEDAELTIQSVFAADVLLSVTCPNHRVQALLPCLRDAVGGRVAIERLESPS
jgi:uncharacterized YigZ family protein